MTTSVQIRFHRHRFNLTSLNSDTGYWPSFIKHCHPTRIRAAQSIKFLTIRCHTVLNSLRFEFACHCISNSICSDCSQTSRVQRVTFPSSIPSPLAAYKFQENLIRTMVQIENTYFELGNSSNRNCLIICDRGVMDASACE